MADFTIVVINEFDGDSESTRKLAFQGNSQDSVNTAEELANDNDVVLLFQPDTKRLLAMWSFGEREIIGRSPFTSMVAESTRQRFID